MLDLIVVRQQCIPRVETEMLQAIRYSAMAYVARHKGEVRILCFLLALAAVVGSAASIEDFINGFLDGSSSVP